MSAENLRCLAEFDNDTSLQLIENAYNYILNPKSVPVKKLSMNIRIPFSAIYQFLRCNPSKQIVNLDKLGKYLTPEVVSALKGKVYLLYGQNYQKLGLLTNYKVESQKPLMTEFQNPDKYLKIGNINQAKYEGDDTDHSVIPAAASHTKLDYVGCQWKVNVILSTNNVSKVMRPEIILEL